jgi:hypothetical protein
LAGRAVPTARATDRHPAPEALPDIHTIGDATRSTAPGPPGTTGSPVVLRHHRPQRANCANTMTLHSPFDVLRAGSVQRGLSAAGESCASGCLRRRG